jgi:hypothetical protein
MSSSSQALIAILFVLAYLLAPVTLVWGWFRWLKRLKCRTLSSILSFIGLILATASVLLAISTAAYARVHPFDFYDPLLLRIYGWGLLLSLSGLLFGFGGAWRGNPLRWHAPLCALGTLGFWILQAALE